MPRSSGEDDRELCPDGTCIGVISETGRCKVCGAARGSTTPVNSSPAELISFVLLTIPSHIDCRPFRWETSSREAPGQDAIWRARDVRHRVSQRRRSDPGQGHRAARGDPAPLPGADLPGPEARGHRRVSPRSARRLLPAPAAREHPPRRRRACAAGLPRRDLRASRTHRARARGRKRRGASGKQVTASIWRELAGHVTRWFDAVSLGDLVQRGVELGVPRGNVKPPMYFI